MNVLVIPDKFKGTLTAHAAAEAIAAGWRRARPKDSLTLVPMTDGGDGFGEVLGQALGARTQTVRTVDAAHRPCRARWWWEPRSRTAIIESAAVVGLAMLPPKQFHPFELDTFGLGAVLDAAMTKGARRCLLGIGGSATNDGGFGMARALGWEFLDRAGRSLQRWVELPQLAHLRAPRRRHLPRVVVAVDVHNPLLGKHGATRVYGPQKGIRPQDVAAAEKCLRRLGAVVETDLGHSLVRQPGAGAAGGLGFGLCAFAGARLQPGFELFSRQAALARHLQNADLVLTAEGAIDRSTRMGKGVGEIARHCARLRVPCFGLAGVVEDASSPRPFTRLFSLTSLTRPDDARARAAFWLKRLACEAALTVLPQAPVPS